MTAGERGREAGKPTELGKTGWIDTLKRVRAEAKNDNLALIAGGVAFYAFLGMFPALAAIAAIYGLVAEPAQVQQQVQSLGGVLPSGVQDIVRTQLQRVSQTSSSTLGWGVAVSIALALWSASKGTAGMIKALNVAYDEEEKRGFFKLKGVTLLLTLGAILAVVLAVALVVALPAVLGFLGLGSGARVAIQIARWVLLVALVVAGLSVLYRLGPSRDAPRWQWTSPGAILALVLWLAASVAFSLYVSNFGSYNATFGSLAAVAILLLWFFISAYVVLLGAEVNAEAERQTRHDTTRGRPERMGRRGAYAADTVGDAT